MGVDGSITGGSGKVLVLSVRDVEVRLGVAVLLGQTKVDNVDLVATLTNTHEEVVGLDITVNERLGVDVLDAGNQLISEKQHGLEGEFAVAEVEEILQTGSEEVKDHGVVVALGTEPTDKGNTDTTGQGLVDSGLILKLGVLGLDALELDGNLLAGDDVGAEVNITERTRTDLATDAVLVTDTKILPLSLAMCNDSWKQAAPSTDWALSARAYTAPGQAVPNVEKSRPASIHLPLWSF